MHVDLAAEFISALRSTSGRDALREAIAPVVADELRRALAEREEKLEPLSMILGIGRDAARKKLRRDDALAACGVVVGRQWKAKRSTVLAYLSKPHARPTFRVIGAAK